MGRATAAGKSKWDVVRTQRPKPGVSSRAPGGGAAQRRREVVSLLRRLVACDTSNPPGEESRGVALLEPYLRQAGLQCERVARDPARANLLARLPGLGRGPSLGFLGHLDVVPVTGGGWSVDPFAGIERDGAIWGRGTVDMKGHVAASAVALATLARDGFEPEGDLMLLLMADEEVGTAGVGASFFVQQRPDLSLDYVVGEGAGERFQTPAGPLYLLACGTKATVEVVMKVRGRPGDISLPDAGPNALYETARLLGRLHGHRFPTQVSPAVAPLIDALSPGAEAVEARVERARCAAGPALGRIVTALTSTVIHPSVLAADGPKNAVAEEATLTFSASTLPGVDAQDLERELRQALGEGAYELEVVTPNGGLVSDADTALTTAIESFLSEHDPGARLVPALGYGYSDCDVMREAYGSVAYGFIPFRYGDPSRNLDTKHGIDEHVLIDDLAFQTEAALWIARTISTPAVR